MFFQRTAMLDIVDLSDQVSVVLFLNFSFGPWSVRGTEILVLLASDPGNISFCQEHEDPSR